MSRHRAANGLPQSWSDEEDLYDSNDVEHFIYHKIKDENDDDVDDVDDVDGVDGDDFVNIVDNDNSDDDLMMMMATNSSPCALPVKGGKALLVRRTEDIFARVFYARTSNVTITTMVIKYQSIPVLAKSIDCFNRH